MHSHIQLKAHPFDLKDVRLLDGPFKDAMERDRAYLHDLDPDRLLHMFRVTAGLPSSSEAYGGWEEPECEIRGHTIGHYLTACALMCSSTGDEPLREKAENIVAELAKCQEAMPSQGYNEGYLEAFPESFFDRVDNLQPVWVPWYTCHKIMAGLLDMHIHCGSRQALDVCNRMADWAKFRTDRLTEEHMQKTLDLEFGGMQEVLASLYAVTGDPDHIALASRFDKRCFLDPLAEGHDKLTGLHSNTHIPMVVGAAREYEMTGDKRYRGISSYFWREVTGKRSFATGGTSNYEHWRSDAGVMSTELSVESQESCCTYNMLKLTRHLFTWEPGAAFADYYERALLNGILCTQHPENGMMMYYVSMKPGHFKVFNTPHDAFWCCTGSGIENHAKYGDSIYFHDDRGLWVNLFIASEVTWAARGLKLRQETSFPDDDKTSFTLSLDTPQEFALRVRVPGWAVNGITLRVNGEHQPVRAMPGSYLELTMLWQDGDRVDIEMPMSLHLAPMPDDPDTFAIMYGPLVLAGKLGTENFSKEMQFVPNQRRMHGHPGIQVPAFVGAGDDVDDWVKPVDGHPFTFRTAGVGRPEDVTLIPLHRLFDERYSVYWNRYTEDRYLALEQERAEREAREAAEQKDVEERTIDRVQPGDEASDAAHNLQFETSDCTEYFGRKGRFASLGGWFSWELRVDPERPQALRCEYWGQTSGSIFDVLVDGRVIKQETLTGEYGEKFIFREYHIPFELTRGRESVTVRFQTHPGNYVGRVYSMAVLNHTLE